MAWATGADAHPALVAALIDALEWPDFRLAKDLYRGGVPVVGWRTIPAFGVVVAGRSVIHWNPV